MSFRARVALAASAAVAVAVVVVSVAAYFIVRGELRGEVDDSLRGTAAQIVRRSEGPERFRGPRNAFFRQLPRPLLGGPGGYVQLVTDDGTAVRPTGNEIALPVGDRALAVAAGNETGYFTDAEAAETHLRVLTMPLAPGVALQIARPLEEVDRVLRGLRLVLLLVSVGGVGLAAVLGLVVTRTALSPVRDLTETTEHITETRDLTRRIDVSGHDELARLATSFNTMLEALDESVRAQRRLVADASHELRTPLTSLRTNIETLARADGLTDDEREETLRDVTEQLEQMTRLVADVVDLARGAEPQQLMEDVRLDLLVADAVKRARKRVPKPRFETVLEESVVRGDPARLDRAVSNMLDNASKWSPPKALIEVRVNEGEITVRDHGPGIAPSDLPFIFDRFYRAPSARELPGSGLGLAIVRQVAESHGGTVSAEAAEGGGTLMRLRLSPSS